MSKCEQCEPPKFAGIWTSNTNSNVWWHQVCRTSQLCRLKKNNICIVTIQTKIVCRSSFLKTEFPKKALLSLLSSLFFYRNGFEKLCRIQPSNFKFVTKRISCKTNNRVDCLPRLQGSETILMIECDNTLVICTDMKTTELALSYQWSKY